MVTPPIGPRPLTDAFIASIAAYGDAPVSVFRIAGALVRLPWPDDPMGLAALARIAGAAVTRANTPVRAKRSRGAAPSDALMRVRAAIRDTATPLVASSLLSHINRMAPHPSRAGFAVEWGQDGAIHAYRCAEGHRVPLDDVDHADRVAVCVCAFMRPGTEPPSASDARRVLTRVGVEVRRRWAGHAFHGAPTCGDHDPSMFFRRQMLEEDLSFGPQVLGAPFVASAGDAAWMRAVTPDPDGVHAAAVNKMRIVVAPDMNDIGRMQYFGLPINNQDMLVVSQTRVSKITREMNQIATMKHTSDMNAVNAPAWRGKPTWIPALLSTRLLRRATLTALESVASHAKRVSQNQTPDGNEFRAKVASLYADAPTPSPPSRVRMALEAASSEKNAMLALVNPIGGIFGEHGISENEYRITFADAGNVIVRRAPNGAWVAYSARADEQDGKVCARSAVSALVAFVSAASGHSFWRRTMLSPESRERMRACAFVRAHKDDPAFIAQAAPPNVRLMWDADAVRHGEVAHVQLHMCSWECFARTPTVERVRAFLERSEAAFGGRLFKPISWEELTFSDGAAQLTLGGPECAVTISWPDVTSSKTLFKFTPNRGKGGTSYRLIVSRGKRHLLDIEDVTHPMELYSLDGWLERSVQYTQIGNIRTASVNWAYAVDDCVDLQFLHVSGRTMTVHWASWNASVGGGNVMV